MRAELATHFEPRPSMPGRQTGTFRRFNPGEMLVARGGGSFYFEGKFGELSQRAHLSRILQALLDAHLANPGQWLECPRLIASAWPGERMNASSAMNRLHVAIATLRKLGLSPLESKKGAYRFRTDVRVVVADDAQAV